MIALLRWLLARKRRMTLRILVLDTNCVSCNYRHIWRGPLGYPVEMRCHCGATTRLTFHPETGALLDLSVEVDEEDMTCG